MNNQSITNHHSIPDDKKYLRLLQGEAVIDPNQFDVANESARDYLASNTGSLSQSSINTYESRLRLWVNFLNNERCSSVMEADVHDFAIYLQHCASERGNRLSTIRSSKSTVKELYNYIELYSDTVPQLTSGQINGINIELFEGEVPDPIQREPLSEEDFRKLLDAMDSPRNRMMTKSCYQLGVRNKDIRGLERKNINYDDLTVTIKYSKGNKTYTVPITWELALELENYEDTYLKGTIDEKFLFPSQNGGRLNHNTSFSRIVKQAAEDAGIQREIGTVKTNDSAIEAEEVHFHKVTPHALRHSIITHLKKHKVSDEYRSKFAGHTSVQTTNEYYTHIGDTDRLETIRNALSSFC